MAGEPPDRVSIEPPVDLPLRPRCKDEKYDYEEGSGFIYCRSCGDIIMVPPRERAA
jgi:hypothetical protein